MSEGEHEATTTLWKRMERLRGKMAKAMSSSAFVSDRMLATTQSRRASGWSMGGGLSYLTEVAKAATTVTIMSFRLTTKTDEYTIMPRNDSCDE